jgi:hypothetical protein
MDAWQAAVAECMKGIVDDSFTMPVSCCGRMGWPLAWQTSCRRLRAVGCYGKRAPPAESHLATQIELSGGPRRTSEGAHRSGESEFDTLSPNMNTTAQENQLESFDQRDTVI